MTKKKKTIGTSQSDLEKLAQAMFERHSLDFNGVKANWYYLGQNRKIAWVKEAHYFSRFVLEKFKVHVNSPMKLGPAQTTYENGYNHGLLNERSSLSQVIQQLEENLDEQLQDFQSQN